MVKNHFVFIWIRSGLATVVLCLPNRFTFLSPIASIASIASLISFLSRWTWVNRTRCGCGAVPCYLPGCVLRTCLIFSWWCWQLGMKNRIAMVICYFKGNKNNELWLVTTNITPSLLSRSAEFCFGVPSEPWCAQYCLLHGAICAVLIDETHNWELALFLVGKKLAN